MCRSNDEYEAWVLERGYWAEQEQERYAYWEAEERGYWAEQEQERYAYWEAEMNAERDYYCYMAPLFWYANGFYKVTPSPEAGDED